MKSGETIVRILKFIKLPSFPQSYFNRNKIGFLYILFTNKGKREITFQIIWGGSSLHPAVNAYILYTVVKNKIWKMGV